jgi:TusA-related sulfurtransferase
MKTNEILEILGRDPDTRMDIFKIIPDFAYELIEMEDMGPDDSYRVQMKKRIDIQNR